ncbi:site-specific DNA-methyltransferase [Aeromonas sanarellii]|jgi:adenine-specific DNA-methyltransferase|uniref:site-specific DNA-methyltransferase n=1 Tax=Aeromonas sanarellii TaxID=633415 RepID=UPI003B9E71C1
MNKQKLELTWIGKDKRPRLEPRIFLEDKGLSYQAPSISTSSDSDINRAFNDNLLIQGDNLLALKALEQQYADKVKCIFIDPPYNTGSAFTHYDDGLEHSMWLTMMRDRLELLRSLMSEDSSLWITIDDNESHYLKVVCDEVFGRNNFVANVVWQKKYSPANDAIWLSDSHDHILVYAKNKLAWRPNLLPRTESSNAAYKNLDNDPRGPWKSGDYTCNKNSDERPNLYYPIKNPFTGELVWPKKTSVWRFNPEAHKKNVEENLIWWGKDGKNSVPSFKRFLDSVKKDGTVPQTIWLWNDVGHTQDGKKEQLQINPKNPFTTPKPEKLLERIIRLATKEGDLVLDSFGGSGTTGAVAHKMDRRWIMVELGDHCHTHIVPRLKKVIDGEDQGGISKAVNWQGGGGFRYLRLAPSLLKKDDWGNWVINKEYNAEMLAEAVCKHMGFTYAPSQTQFWNHGYSTETDHIYVTTGSLAYDQLKRISEEVGNERTLLICCKAFMMDGADFPNLTLKKIPKVILNKCEWDHDDYSFTLNVLPEEQDEEWADDDSEE